MSIRSWWRNRTFLGKAIVALAALLLLQITLALSGEYAAFPLYDAITHTRIEDGERGPGLLALFQLMLCLPTLALLVIAFVVRAILSWRRQRSIPTIVPSISIREE